MKHQAITLVIATAIGSMLLAACDRTEQKTPQAGADKRVDSPTPAPGSSSAPLALGAPSTEAEKKAGVPPVQGEVDTRELAQRSEFEQKK